MPSRASRAQVPSTSPIPAAPRRMLRLTDVCAVTGLSRTTIYRLIYAGAFPKPAKLSPRTNAWLASEVDAYCEARAAERTKTR